jgi:hypothetical protein
MITRRKTLDGDLYLNACLMRERERELKTLYLLSKRALNRWSCKEFHIRTQVIKALFAQGTSPAGNTRLQGNTVSNCQIFHFTAYLFYNTCTLMPYHHGLLDHIISNLKVLHSPHTLP